jgi:hypothetical protein
LACPELAHVAPNQVGTPTKAQHAPVQALFLQGLIDALAAQSGIALAIRLPDGSESRAGNGAPRFTLVFRNEAALLDATLRGHMGLLESCFAGAVDSDAYFSREDFARAYAMDRYAALKARYDPQGRLLGLYEKCVLRA